MEKQTITIEKNQIRQVIFESQLVLIDSYISLENKMKMANSYLDSVFNDNNISENFLTAEYGLMLIILDLCTNIQVFDEEGKISVDINKVEGSGLWDLIKSNIVNFDSFKKDILLMIEHRRNSVSVSKKFEDIIDGLSNFLDTINRMDISKESIMGLVEEIRAQIPDSATKKEFFPEVDTVINVPQKRKYTKKVLGNA
jgi:hypothetical protein